jgi:uncharacterized membrane protein YfcA
MVVAVLALAMTGISKGGFGGVGVLSIPMMMAVAPAKFSLGMWLPVLVVCDILTLRYYPKEWKPRPVLLIAPWTLLGIVLGALLLGYISARATKLFVGATSITFVGLDVLRSWLKYRIDRGRDLPAFRPTWLTASPFGIAAGITTMLAHAAGAITTIYFLPQRMDKRDFVGTQARFYFVFNSAKIPFYALVPLMSPRFDPLITRETLIKSIWMLPLAPLFVWAGAALNDCMSPAVFHRVVYVLLAISGAYLLYANV